jgi:nucleoside 2-deoxyribosyltransferase
MRNVYLCGGINGLTDGQCNNWRNEARGQLNGFNLIDPMRRDYRGRENECVNEIVELDKEDVCKSDIILVNATRPSWGTAMEVMFAYIIGKHIVSVVSDVVSPWTRYHSSKIFTTWQGAFNYIGTLNE